MLDFRPENFVCPRVDTEVLLIVLKVPAQWGGAQSEILYDCSHRDSCKACRGCDEPSRPATLWDCAYNRRPAEDPRH